MRRSPPGLTRWQTSSSTVTTVTCELESCSSSSVGSDKTKGVEMLSRLEKVTNVLLDGKLLSFNLFLSWNGPGPDLDNVYLPSQV